MQLSVIVLATDTRPHPATLLPAIRQALDSNEITGEIVVVISPGDGAYENAAQAAGARVVVPGARGYGRALQAGFAAAAGEWVLTMDADEAHPPKVIAALWAARREAEIVIGSRFVDGGRAVVSLPRYVFSRALNIVFSRGLSLRVADMSSGFRLYLRRALLSSHAQPLPPHFAAVQALLVRAYAEGWRVAEVPFTYEPRGHGGTSARLVRFGLDYARTFFRLWKLRNSIECADYDARAHDSPIPLQRYWQRLRYRYVTELFTGEGAVLDVGCGSSRIISALPKGSVAADILLRKLRYSRRYRAPLVQASAFALPFADESFSCVLCSQVIEHVPKDSPILSELVRVLKPGGRLVLGTPDYANWQWVITEKAYGVFAPGAYADEHIAHYSREELLKYFSALGFTHEATRYILRGELILALRKRERPAPGD
jgi:SAM-dependent methyltransferase